MEIPTLHNYKEIYVSLSFGDGYSFDTITFLQGISVGIYGNSFFLSEIHRTCYAVDVNFELNRVGLNFRSGIYWNGANITIRKIVGRNPKK